MDTSKTICQNQKLFVRMLSKRKHFAKSCTHYYSFETYQITQYFHSQICLLYFAIGSFKPQNILSFHLDRVQGKHIITFKLCVLRKIFADETNIHALEEYYRRFFFTSIGAGDNANSIEINLRFFLGHEKQIIITTHILPHAVFTFFLKLAGKVAVLST